MTYRPLAEKALALALAYADAGTLESGGPNRGDQVEWFQRVAGGAIGESWCADFGYACLLKADCVMKGLLMGDTDQANRLIMLGRADTFSRTTHIPRTGSCIDVADAAKQQGRFHGKDFSPSPGDLVLFDFKGEGEPHHVGFVISRNVDGSLRTVEGNTSSSAGGSQSNGGGVYRRVRQRSVVYGFVHFE